MLETSNFISAREGANELNKVLKEFQEVQAIKKDLELKLKPIETKFKGLQETIMAKSEKGLNETSNFTWEFHVSADSETISIKDIIKSAPEIYDMLKAKNLVNIRKGAKSIKNVSNK